MAARRTRAALAFASSAFSAETPAADGWFDRSGRADAEAQAASVLDEVGKALTKNDPGLAKGTLARILVACDCKVALKSAKGSPAVTALANEVAGEEKPWSPAPDESTLEFVTRLFAEAVKRAAPSLKDQDPVVQRCAIASFGDFQCNAPMGIFKALKGQGDATYNSPRAVGAAIADNLPPNSVLVSASVAPAGFVNAKIDNALLGDFCRSVAQQGKAPPSNKSLRRQAQGTGRLLAAEHRQGDARRPLALYHHRRYDLPRPRVLRPRRPPHQPRGRLGHAVRDAHLARRRPTRTLPNPPNITDLTVFYKNAKKRFDDDEAFGRCGRRSSRSKRRSEVPRDLGLAL